MIASVGRQTLALGNPTFFWLDRDQMAPSDAISDTAAAVWAFTRGGALIDSAGTAAGVPSVDTHYPRRTPRLVGRNSDTLTVVWATADSAAKNPGANDNRVELSSFDGQSWSAPRVVIGAQHVELQHPPATRPSTRLTPSVIAAIARDSAGTFVRVARAHGETWMTSDWRGRIFTLSSASATTWADGSMTVLVMGSLFDSSSRPVPGVYSIRGEPNATGYAWTAPQLLDSLRDSYQSFSSARLGGDSLIVAWSGPRVGGGDAILNTTLSVDRGETWSLTSPLAPGSAIDGVQLVVDGNGVLHAVFRVAAQNQATVLNSPGLVMGTAWRSGSWTTPIAISKDSSWTSPDVGAAGNGGLMTIWATGEVSPLGGAPKSFASVWTSECDRLP